MNNLPNNLSDDLFRNSRSANTFMNGIDVDILYPLNKCLAFWKNSGSLKNSVFSTLTSLLKYWRIQNKVNSPRYFDYLCGFFCSLPHLDAIKKKFYAEVR